VAVGSAQLTSSAATRASAGGPQMRDFSAANPMPDLDGRSNSASSWDVGITPHHQSAPAVLSPRRVAVWRGMPRSPHRRPCEGWV
jgi:hypothetical protein